MYSLGRLFVVVCLLMPGAVHAAGLNKVPPDRPQLRRPVALRSLNKTTAIVANRRSGTLSLIDLGKGTVAAEFALGGQPSDLDVFDRKHVLVTDAQRSLLVAVAIDRTSAGIVWQLPMPKDPVSVRVSPDGRWCTVCSLWARKVTIVRLPGNAGKLDSPQVVATVDLPFAPREQLHLADHSRLIVADAFGGRLAVISLESHQVEAVRSLPAHNIRGLVLHPKGDRLFMTHQILNELAPPRASDIIWGVMLTNGIRAIQLQSILDPKADLMQGSRFIPLGDGSRGAGDPDSLTIDRQGRMVVALAGIGEVAIVEPDGYSLQRVPVGNRPVAVQGIADNRFLVANEFSDSLSLVDLAADPGVPAATDPKRTTKSRYATEADDPYIAPNTYSVNRAGNRDADVAVRHIGLGATPKPGAAERGEMLFYNARVSHGNWFSCHSCHTDGHSNGGLADTLSDGSGGSPKRILSLLGVTETGPWSWKGNKPSLRDQVHQSARITMQGRGLSDDQATDLVAYLKTLAPPPPYQPAVSADDAALLKQGRKLFTSLNCHACHAGHTLTSADSYDVGLTDELGTKEFNPPSLRGVGHRSGWFHKKQAKSLEDVVVRFGHQLPQPLSREQQQALIRYLKSL